MEEVPLVGGEGYRFKQSGESVESVLKKKGRLRWKDLQKRKVLSLESVSYTHLTLPTIYSV